jgi:hypothetical protein
MKQFLDFLHDTKTQAYGFFIVLIGFPCLIAFAHLSEGLSNRLLDIVLLSATFYWGSSKSGAVKDEAISNLSANQSAPTITNADTVSIDQSGK